MKLDFKFEIGDKVLIKPGTTYLDAIGVSGEINRSSFNKMINNKAPATIISRELVTHGSISTTLVYKLQFQDGKSVFHFKLPERLLELYIKLTPETDAVFRDIIRNV
jgi:hypothetical protein